MDPGPTDNVHIALYRSPQDILTALDRVCQANFDMGKVSVVARESVVPGQAAACYGRDGGMRYFGRLGDFWNDLWRVLTGSACFMIAEYGAVLVAGPLAVWLLAALKNAALFDGLSPVGAGLYSIGIPRNGIGEYEQALKSGRYLILVHGTASEVAGARGLLLTERPAEGESR